VEFDLGAYLVRVGLEEAPETGEEGLRTLHHAQFFTIAFENLDIHLGRGIDLDPAAVFAKVVRKPRGGYCFELNGLLDRALNACGFDSRPLLARVHLEGTPSARTHQLCLVELEDRSWIADAGFGGGGPRHPLPLEEGATFDDGVQACRLVRRDPWGWLLQTRDKGAWKDSYSFDLGLVTPADIALGNHYTSTSPVTHFTRIRTLGLPTDDGRVTLRDFTLNVVRGSDNVTREVEPGPAYMELISEKFRIEVDAGFEDLQAPAGD